jgi:hypothetical protein
MAKLSSREKAAQKAGGTLNYKSGKISVPVKKTPVRSTASSKPSGKVAIASNADGTTRYSDGTSSNAYASNVGETAGIVEARFNAQEKGVLPKSSPKKTSNNSSSNKSSSKSSNNNSIAAGFRSVLGINDANASTNKPKLITGTTHDTNTLGNIVSTLGNAALGAPGAIYKGITGHAPDLGLTEALGLSKDSPNLTYNPGTEAVIDPTTGRSILPSIGGGSSTVTDQSLADNSLFGAPGTRSQAANDYITQRNTGTGGKVAIASNADGTVRYSDGTSSNPYASNVGETAGIVEARFNAQESGNQRIPKPVQNYPATQQNFTPSTGISQNFTPAIGQVPTPQPDFTPIVQEQPGTNRGFLGNGLLSNGMASNGAGNYGIQGNLTGTGGALDEQSLLNQLLGIPTAQAQEMPQASFADQNASFAPMSFNNSFTDMNKAFSSGGLSGNNPYQTPQAPQASFNPTNQVQTNEAPTPQIQRQQNPGGSQSGGVAQQFAQGATGGNPALDYQKQSLKGFSQQEKAQKKALNELLKSIKNQYSTKEKSGLTDLNKAKQEDLLKLSGLFSFANQDPDSEQRIQYEQRANQDYAKQQADFLAQLASAQSQDISVAKQGYNKELAGIASQRNAVQEKISQMLYQAQQDALARQSSGSRGGSNTAQKQQQAAIQALLAKAANMPTGGREFAQQQANMMGLGNISGYTPNGWESAYNKGFGQAPQTRFTSIGNGYVMDPSTGDVFQAYDPNNF